MKLLPMVLAALLCVPATANADKKGRALEVTARLAKIPGKFPPDDLYDYAFVMKYKVTTGKLKGQTILVAHYKPRRPRKKIRDKMKKHVKGKLKRFKEGALHSMKLTPGIRTVWKGAVVDLFFAADRKSVRYWCLRVDPAG